ncbi:hypothetical protein IT411_01990 [Candidatus Peregrinibacteria bacterium]|nr:hypothetical protein [Candidatus Peregrinibacteria bacterium]
MSITPISVFPQSTTEKYLPAILLQHGDLIAFTGNRVLHLRGEIRQGARIIPSLRLDELRNRPTTPAATCQLGFHKEKGEIIYEDLYVIAEAPMADQNMEEMVRMTELELLEDNLLIERYPGPLAPEWHVAFRIKNAQPD